MATNNNMEAAGEKKILHQSSDDYTSKMADHPAYDSSPKSLGLAAGKDY